MGLCQPRHNRQKVAHKKAGFADEGLCDYAGTPSSSMATTSTIYKFGWFFRSKVVSSRGQTKTREMTKMGATTALLGPWAM